MRLMDKSYVHAVDVKGEVKFVYQWVGKRCAL